jgi:septum formation protein
MVVFEPISEQNPLVLASSSPRRRELLRQAGVAIQVVTAPVEELVLSGESSVEAARRLALEKAQACWTPGRWVLAADTIVVVDGEILGKPLDRADGDRMLALLSDREHEVITGFSLLDPTGRPIALVEVTTEVRFVLLTPEDRAAYLDSGEPFGKAGAYAIQGIGAVLVQGIRGSYTNVVGLPLAEVVQALRAAGALTLSTLAAGRAALEDAP